MGTRSGVNLGLPMVREALTAEVQETRLAVEVPGVHCASMHAPIGCTSSSSGSSAPRFAWQLSSWLALTQPSRRPKRGCLWFPVHSAG